MEITLETLDGLPENIKALIKTDDDKHTLDLSGLVPAMELQTEKQQRVTVTEKLARLEKRDGKYKAFGTPEEIQERLDAKVKPDADHEAVVAQIKDRHETELSAVKENLKKVMLKNASAGLKVELARVGVIPDALDMATATGLNRVQVDEDGNISILNAAGTGPLAGSGDDGFATTADLAKELAVAMPFAIQDKGAGGGGKPPESQGGKTSKTIKRAEFDALDPASRVATMKEGTTVVD